MGKAKPKQAATKPRTTKGRTNQLPDQDASSLPTDDQPVQCAKTLREGAEDSQDQDTKLNAKQESEVNQTPDTSQSQTPLVDMTTEEDRQGDVTLRSAAGGPEDSLPPPPGGLPCAHARPGESRAECWERLRKSARSAGLPRGQGPGTAYEYATQCVEVLFAPVIPEPEPVAESITEPAPESAPEPETLEIPAHEPDTEPDLSPIVDKTPSPSGQDVGGLGDLPPDWPTLPANASLQVEIAWVSANRLRVRDGTGVDLSKALSPAPSYSALSWLETSILFPSKFADISVKATANQDYEKESIRREKLSIEEVRSILAEMLEG